MLSRFAVFFAVISAPYVVEALQCYCNVPVLCPSGTCTQDNCQTNLKPACQKEQISRGSQTSPTITKCICSADYKDNCQKTDLVQVQIQGAIKTTCTCFGEKCNGAAYCFAFGSLIMIMMAALYAMK